MITKNKFMVRDELAIANKNILLVNDMLDLDYINAFEINKKQLWKMHVDLRVINTIFFPGLLPRP